MNKASGGDRISAELFQILKDDAVKVLNSICQNYHMTQKFHYLEYTLRKPKFKEIYVPQRSLQYYL